MSKYITNLVEDPEESSYGLISVYNMVHRVYGKETADAFNSDPEIKEKYHKRILSLYNNAKKNNWYNGTVQAKKLPSTHAGAKDLNMKYTKWWLEKQVKKYNPMDLFNKSFSSNKPVTPLSPSPSNELPF